MFTDTQSYSFAIYDGLFNVLAEDPFFAGWTTRQSKALTVQGNLIPYLGLYIIDEVGTPDGDGNAGDIRFINTLRLGFSAIIKNSDTVAAQRQLDAVYWFIKRRLLCDPDITNLMSTKLPDNIVIESFPRVMHRFVWGATALNQEMPLGELQLELSCLYRSTFDPIIVDDLHKIVVTTSFPAKGTDEERIKIQKVTSVYDFTEDTPGIELDADVEPELELETTDE